MKTIAKYLSFSGSSSNRPLPCLFSAVDFELARMNWRVKRFNKSSIYAYTTIDREVVLAHRLIMGCEPKDGKYVDHINGNKLDNRRENLRIVNAKQNTWNKPFKTKSGYFGVQERSSGKFSAKFYNDGEYIPCGLHETAEAAARAVNEKLLELRGEFAVLNQV